MNLTDLLEKNKQGLWIPKLRLGDIVEIITTEDVAEDPDTVIKVAYYGGIHFESKAEPANQVVLYRPPIDEALLTKSYEKGVRIFTALNKSEFEKIINQYNLYVNLTPYSMFLQTDYRLPAGKDGMLDESGKRYFGKENGDEEIALNLCGKKKVDLKIISTRDKK
ncbi:MAG: hypothetical protein AABX04_00170 [Nanoarchaeota archaeon]